MVNNIKWIPATSKDYFRFVGLITGIAKNTLQEATKNSKYRDGAKVVVSFLRNIE